MLHAIDSVRELIEVKELSSEGGRTKPKSSTEKETGDDPLAEFAAAIEKAELSGTERRVANLVLSKGGGRPSWMHAKRWNRPMWG